MKKILAALLAATCAISLAAGELKIIKAEWGNGDKVNDATEALLKHMRGIEGVFFYITPTNSEFGPDPAPGKKKTLTVIYTDGGAQKTVVIPEKQKTAVVANAVPSKEFKLVGAFYGCGEDWNDASETIFTVLEAKESVVISNKAFGPDPAPGRPKELWIVYSKDGKIDFAPLKERTTFSEDALKEISQ